MDELRQNTENEDFINDPNLNTKVAKTYDFKYAFKQQLLTEWRPKPTLKCAISVYIIIGIVFFILGIIILVFSNEIYDKEIRYDNNPLCAQLDTTCSISFVISEDMKAPIYVYYRIKGFYQNHRKYINSIPIEQLNGNDLPASQLKDCEPFLYNKDISVSTAVDGTPLDPDDVAIPCGIAAKFMFTDNYTLVNADTNVVYEITDEGIAWDSDINHKFNNIDLSRQWVDMENERFITWMKVAPFNDFLKAYGVIQTDLAAGNYLINIDNQWNVEIFNGEKYFVLSETNVFGGKNEFLAYTYIAVGMLSLILCIVFIFRKLQKPKGILHKFYKDHNFDTNAETDLQINQ